MEGITEAIFGLVGVLIGQVFLGYKSTGQTSEQTIRMPGISQFASFAILISILMIVLWL